MEKLKEQILMNVSDKDFRREVIRKLNQIVGAINTGVVHENKVQATRAVNGVYDSLPVSVVAAMVEEEVAVAAAELNLESEVI